MATIPPPYTSRDQARMAARAQRDAYRAQRDYWRTQRRPSVVRPILLVVIGLIALLIETGKLDGHSVWECYMRWWPLLLIGIGALSLGEWWLERDRPYGARRGVGGLVFWIILIALLGSGSHLGWHHFGDNDWQPFSDGDSDFSWHLFGQEHSATTELTQVVPANSSFRVQNPLGDVTVSPSSDNSVHVTSRDVVYASSDKDANKQLKNVAPRITVSGNQVVIESSDINNAHADLTIEMPTDAALDINAQHGDVTVDGTRNNVTVDSGKGDVKLDNITGNVHTHMSKGDFSATAVSGEVVVDGRMDDVSLSSIKNHVSLNGDFFGEMHLQQLVGPLNVHSSRTDIQIASVPGSLTLDKGDLSFKNVTGPVRAITHASDVEATLVKGSAHLEGGNGDMSLSAVAPIETIEIHNSNGSVDLTLPPDAKFDLDASTSDGDLSTDFNVPVNTQGDRQTATGKVGGGGPTITVSADHGDVHIRKAGASSSDSDDDSDGDAPPPPKAPKAPKAPRHLHAATTDETPASVQ
jgi:DUF4097 and DUF4098 domain-containing protein YvlB